MSNGNVPAVQAAAPVERMKRDACAICTHDDMEEIEQYWETHRRSAARTCSWLQTAKDVDIGAAAVLDHMLNHYRPDMDRRTAAELEARYHALIQMNPESLRSMALIGMMKFILFETMMQAQQTVAEATPTGMKVKADLVTSLSKTLLSVIETESKQSGSEALAEQIAEKINEFYISKARSAPTPEDKKNVEQEMGEFVNLIAPLLGGGK